MEYTREKSVVHVVFLRTTNFSTFLACVHLVNIRATLGLACAQAATLCTQVVGNTRSYLSLLRVRVALNLRSLDSLVTSESCDRNGVGEYEVM